MPEGIAYLVIFNLCNALFCGTPQLFFESNVIASCFLFLFTRRFAQGGDNQGLQRRKVYYDTHKDKLDDNYRAYYARNREEICARRRLKYLQVKNDLLRRLRDDVVECPECHNLCRRLYLPIHIRRGQL